MKLRSFLNFVGIQIALDVVLSYPEIAIGKFLKTVLRIIAFALLFELVKFAGYSDTRAADAILKSRWYTVVICSGAVGISSAVFGYHAKAPIHREWCYCFGILVAATYRFFKFSLSQEHARTKLIYSVSKVSVMMGVYSWSVFLSGNELVSDIVCLTAGVFLGEATIMALLLITNAARSHELIILFSLSGLFVEQARFLGMAIAKFEPAGILDCTPSHALMSVPLVVALGACFIRFPSVPNEKGQETALHVEDEIRPWLWSNVKSLHATPHIYRDTLWFTLLAYRCCVLSGLLMDSENTQIALESIWNFCVLKIDPTTGEWNFKTGTEGWDWTEVCTVLYSPELWDVVEPLLILPMVRQGLCAVWARTLGLKFYTLAFMVQAAALWHNTWYGDFEIFAACAMRFSLTTLHSVTPPLANLANNVRKKHISVQCQLFAVLVAGLAIGPLALTTFGTPIKGLIPRALSTVGILSFLTPAWTWIGSIFLRGSQFLIKKPRLL